MKIILIILITFFLLLIIIEIALRLLFGLGNPPLYLADENMGYLLAPNQNVKRFGHRIIINNYGQRTNFNPSENDPNFIILALGDSIINGGWWTDQDKTIPELIKSHLLLSNGQVLNASANSWGPPNQLAYLRNFGTFQAKIVVLVLNTDDLFATAPTALAVGRDRNYPATQPSLAIIELYSYITPKREIPEMAKIQGEKGDRVGINLEAIKEIKKIAEENKAEFFLTLTPLLREVESSGPRDYEIKARQRLKEFSEKEKIPYLDFLSIFQTELEPENLYRDHIHLSEKGNQLVSKKISEKLKQYLP